MKNKNIRNQPQKCSRQKCCRFSSGVPPNPSYRENKLIKPSKPFFNNNSNQRQKKEPEAPH